ncbi:MATE family efflux transporter [Frisingicoccus sp.]|uniref:MATE family efflux transporter n=1 Tax=Frisingicoccus sp. TaxID=1918627 RepID=UPI0015C11648
MENIKAGNNPLGTEPISRLIFKYSVPTALTLMVNYLYNIVDQMFVGQGVGITGMAATNVAFPLTIIFTATGLLIGDGSAANISLCLGRKEQETADKIVSHAVTMLVLSGVLLCLICILFAPGIVQLFGATETAFQDSLIYTRTVAWGLPFLMLCTALTAVIRADGNPKYTMKCMMTGAVINIVLDWLFIFPFSMGVFGAALATVIGQIVSGSLCFAYLRKLKTVHVHKDALKLTGVLSGRILALGLPSLITQIMTAVVQIIMNNLMTIYGAGTAYGSDIALSVYGMMMKVYQIAHAMFVGVSSATQPINGYNFGAKNYDRVRKTYKTAAGIAILISILWFAVYQLLPGQIAGLFVSGNPLYTECAAHSFRIYMLAFFLYGLHMTTASFFQGIGKPSRALVISLVRQAVLMIPLSLILSGKFGLDGALMAAPITDTLVFILALTLAVNEFRQWKKQGL